jgi:hypothetical protein
MKVYKLILVFVLVTALQVQAQFQRKFTIDVGVSYLYPHGGELRGDRLPYLFSNFEYGYGTYTNLLYNFSKKFSVGLAVNLSTFQSWQDPRKAASVDQSYFNIYNVNPNIKYKILVRDISPFVMVGAGMSVYHARRAQSKVLIKNFYPWDFEQDGEFDWVSIDEVLIREPGFEIKPQAAFNTVWALGLNFKVSESVGITVMACYNLSFTGRSVTLDQNLRYLSFPVGVNLSIGKSKTL